MMDDHEHLAWSGSTARIKVAFFAEILTEGLDGAVRTMYQLINRIDADRFDFLFVYGDGPDSIRGFKGIRVPSLNLSINTGYSLAMPVFAQSRVKEALQLFAPDLVHIATPSLLGNFGLNYALQHKLPVLTIYHTHFISYIDYYFKRTPFLIGSMKQLLAANYRAFYNKCNTVYVPSESIQAELEDIGIDGHRMVIWKRGIDTSLFSPTKKDKEALKKLTGNDSPTVLFASRLVWEKNLETLFDIYDHLQASDLSVNFLVVGDGTALKACKARMPCATFTGKVSHSQLAVLYASADVFLFPSVSETYGNVVLEAMASGLPCVIADGGGSRDFIEQGINGFRCSPNDAGDYAEKIAFLLSADSLKKQIIKEGLRYVRHFSWQALTETYFDMVAQLAWKAALVAV